MSLFGDWIAVVDEDGAEKALLEKVLTSLLEEHHIATVPALASHSQTDLESAEGWPTDLETTSFLRRCHQMAAKASAVKAQYPSVAPNTAGEGGLRSQAHRQRNVCPSDHGKDRTAREKTRITFGEHKFGGSLPLA